MPRERRFASSWRWTLGCTVWAYRQGTDTIAPCTGCRIYILQAFFHLCVSDGQADGDRAYTAEQLQTFYDTVDWIREQDFDPGAIHIQAIYGIWNLPPQPCTYARAGIALYGVGSNNAPVQNGLELRPYFPCGPE